MRAEMISAMKYWILEANIDGYRCDYATGVPGWFWEEAIDSLRAIPGRELLLFAESNDLSLLNEGFDMAFSWNFYGALLDAFNGGDARNLRTTHLGEFSTLASGKTMVRFVTNHDQHAWDDVPQDLLGGQNGAIAAFAAAAYMGGVPLIYNGQEKGLPYQLPFFIPTSVAINWSLNPTITKKYEKIMQVYAQEPALKGPELLNNYSTYSISAFTKANSSDTLLIAINTNSSAKSFTFPVEWQGKQLTDLITGQTAVSSTAISLNGFQYCVWKK
jgi:1,4-alpha-glucan branching enzyme